MKILTAIGNQTLKNKLEEDNFEVYPWDLQYQDALIEILEKNKKIEILYLNSLLPGELNIFELINKIIKINSKIKIIVILEKENETVKNFLNSKNIFDIFYNNKTKIEDLIKIIKKEEKEGKEENRKNKEKIFGKIKKTINKKIKVIKTSEKNKIINIAGPPGVGKTIFTIIYSILIKDNKILIVDLDENKNINKILNLKNKEDKLKEIKYKKNIFVLNLNKKIFTEEEAEKILLEKKNEYEKIIIDSSNNTFNDIEKIVDTNIIILEANLIQINYAKKLLDRYSNLYNKNTKIVFNKYNFYSIDFNILKSIFYQFEIIGKIKENSKYNYFINKEIKIIDTKIKNEFKKIINNL